MPKIALLAFVAVLIIPRTLPAQGETTSAISGLVTDETGSGIPDADITAVSEENGQKRSLKTDQAGRFSFPQLKPGSYTVEASAPQFRPQRKGAVAAGLGDRAGGKPDAAVAGGDGAERRYLSLEEPLQLL